MLKRHTGFSLVELMVAMVAGLLLVAAVISLFATILRADQTAMQTSRLNQEIQSITDQVARDIQRAGYDANATQTLVSGGTSLFYFDAATALMNKVSAGSSLYRCIRVLYDSDDDAALDSNETSVYSYSSTDKGIKQGGASSACGTGNSLSDDDTIEITDMTFKLLPSSQVSGARAIQLNISGQYKSNPALTLNLQRDIKLRNDGH